MPCSMCHKIVIHYMTSITSNNFKCAHYWISNQTCLNKKHNVIHKQSLKKYIVKIFWFRHSRNLLLYNVSTTMLTWCNRWVVSFVDTICCFENNDKKSNLIILDNSGIDYSRMLLFVLGFLVYLKIEQNYDLITNRLCQSCQKNKT